VVSVDSSLSLATLSEFAFTWRSEVLVRVFRPKNIPLTPY